MSHRRAKRIRKVLGKDVARRIYQYAKRNHRMFMESVLPLKELHNVQADFTN